ncbi:hypothetical protein GCM10007036_36580 [Alsobacter metallidurans]|uniref:Tyr recombinase domain-containing protein n=1 Tax=Alsobacter metallidurans TaxID=340221 RepID=A0A917IAA2_9HYPH|nr:tyrosine-type recombinase/integrase [Alsobacter metallidurans]GGH27803.1 hypothetical protein GCM10007036_36580 [Alsobacter metallidurans]
MPRAKQPARLWLRPASKDRAAVWIIRDNGRMHSTGCSEAARAEAEKKLAGYIGGKHNPVADQPAPASETAVLDVLSVYLDDVAPRQARPAKVAERIERLIDWWDGKTLANVSPASCREYAKRAIVTTTPTGKVVIRKGVGGARRDLEDLRAAINHHARRGLHSGFVSVELPAKGKARQRWLTRAEAARLIWACWRHRETQTLHRGRQKGKLQQTQKRPLRHLARFLLIALYTGSRPGAILSASIVAEPGRSYIDLDSGLFYRLAEGARETNKRQPPVPMPLRLLAHIRRWEKTGAIARYPVEFNGLPVKSVKVGFARAVKLAALPGNITPHTLRHTAATWLMHQRVPTSISAAYLGMSEQIFKSNYEHHHPDYMLEARDAIVRRR